MSAPNRISLSPTHQQPLVPDAVRQCAALCHRMGDAGPEVLLINSSRGRWILPKGWPMAGLPGDGTAAQEAWEEAGVRGDVAPTPLGQFATTKIIADDDVRPCIVTVYPLAVTETQADFPEADRRTPRWVTAGQAARLIDTEGLRNMVVAFLSDQARKTARAS